jgi:hypothetical protein
VQSRRPPDRWLSPAGRALSGISGAVRRWLARSSLRLSTSPLEARESEAATGPWALQEHCWRRLWPAAEAACTRARGRPPQIGCAFETCAMRFSPPDSGAVTSLCCDRLGQIYLHVALGKFGRSLLCIVDDISHIVGRSVVTHDSMCEMAAMFEEFL